MGCGGSIPSDVRQQQVPYDQKPPYPQQPGYNNVVPSQYSKQPGYNNTSSMHIL